MTSAFGETLRSITTTKLKEISKKRQSFEENKAQTISALSDDPKNFHQRLAGLINGVKRSFDLNIVSKRHLGSWGTFSAQDQFELNSTLTNIGKFHAQAQYDPTISERLFVDWEGSLLQKLDVQSLKYEYASLYGELVNDWLKSESAFAKDTSAMDVDSFEIVDKAEQQASRKEWEKAVFTPYETDQSVIKSYLDKLFSKSSSHKALIALRTRVQSYEAEFCTANSFTQTSIRWSINGLLNANLLSEEKNQVLRDFLRNPIILDEVVDVLNMRLMSVEDWSWEQEYVAFEQRRHINGNYHIYIDEDLVEAIFLQHVGTSWSVFFKQVFTDFSNHEEAWAPPYKPVSSEELKRRQHFLGPQNSTATVMSKRKEIYKSSFFMSQLPDRPDEEQCDAVGEEEANYEDRTVKRARTKQTAQTATNAVQMPMGMQQQQQVAPQQYQQQLMLLQQQNSQRLRMARQEPRLGFNSPGENHLTDFNFDSYVPPGGHFNFDAILHPTTPMAAKQFILHLLSTEIELNTRLHGDFTAVHSSFEAWSSTLPHTTIKSVLSFYGISKKWLSFFTAFLEAPLRFTNDGPDAPVQKRRRGVPGAHSLSSFCGEAVLFILDYAVNQETDGALLYRMHDDFWLWSPSQETVVRGWSAIETFTDVMGVTINEGKTGSVRIHSDKEQSNTLDPSLPTGSIRWGFLALDAPTGKFAINQEMVDKHISDLRVQLADKKSVFAYIQAWNTYAGTFFLSNFVAPCNAFGREHVDSILSTLRRVQLAVFGVDSNIAIKVKEMITSRFGVDDVPDGYLYFPTSLGGLELQNPFVGLMQMRDSVVSDPNCSLDKYFNDEKEAYEKAKKRYERGVVSPPPQMNQPAMRFSPGSPKAKAEFITFEEFTKYREELPEDWSENLVSVFATLLRKPEVTNVVVDGKGDVTRLVQGCAELDSDYLSWVGVLYGKEMVDRFGGLRVVDKGLLPTGMVNLFRSGRISWQ